MPALSRVLARFFAWWLGELSALVPVRLRQWWRESDRIVMLSFDDSRAVFERYVGAQRERIYTVETAPGDVPAARTETDPRLVQAAGTNYRLLLCVPPNKVLQQTLILPLAVEENLRQTLTFELDRHTPFRPENAYFAFRIAEKDMVRKQLFVDLATVPKSEVDRELSRATALGLTVHGAVLADDLAHWGGDCRNFLPSTANRRSASARLWWRIGMAALSVLLLAIMLAVQPWQKRATALSLLAPLAEAKAEAQETDALRDRLRASVEEHNYLHDKKWETASPVLVLEELSKLLPDDAFVVQLDYDGNTVQIQGETASSTSLVETLEASPMFKEVTVKALISKVQGTANAHFQISAVIRPPAKPERPAASPEASEKDAAAPSAGAPEASKLTPPAGLPAPQTPAAAKPAGAP